MDSVPRLPMPGPPPMTHEEGCGHGEDAREDPLRLVLSGHLALSEAGLAALQYLLGRPAVSNLFASPANDSLFLLSDVPLHLLAAAITARVQAGYAALQRAKTLPVPVAEALHIIISKDICFINRDLLAHVLRPKLLDVLLFFLDAAAFTENEVMAVVETLTEVLVNPPEAPLDYDVRFLSCRRVSGEKSARAPLQRPPACVRLFRVLALSPCDVASSRQEGLLAPACATEIKNVQKLARGRLWSNAMVLVAALARFDHVMREVLTPAFGRQVHDDADGGLDDARRLIQESATVLDSCLLARIRGGADFVDPDAVNSPLSIPRGTPPCSDTFIAALTTQSIVQGPARSALLAVPPHLLRAILLCLEPRSLCAATSTCRTVFRAALSASGAVQRHMREMVAASRRVARACHQFTTDSWGERFYCLAHARTPTDTADPEGGVGTDPFAALAAKGPLGLMTNATAKAWTSEGVCASWVPRIFCGDPRMRPLAAAGAQLPEFLASLGDTDASRAAINAAVRLGMRQMAHRLSATAS